MKEILQKTSIEAELEAKEAMALYWKRLRSIGLTILVSGALAAAGYYFLWPQVRQWRQSRSLVEAEEYEKARDYRRALLTLEQTVQLYPANLEAKRRLANFLERLGQRQCLEIWREIAKADPGDSRNLLGLAGAALRFGEHDLARRTLAQAHAAGHTGPEYYRLVAGVALVTRDNVTLETALSELARLQPDDPRVRLNLAVVRLRSANPEMVAAGRASLTELAHSDPIRIRAVVELLNDLARRWPRPSPERVEAFQQLARALTPPRGPQLDSREKDDPVERLVQFAMRQPDPEPEDIGALLSWMILNGRAAAGFEWLETLSEGARQSPLVAAAASEAALQTRDWPHLRQLILAGAWGLVPPAAVNGAFVLRDARQAGGRADSSQWAAVIEACQASLPALRVVLRLSEAWQWPEEQKQVLTAITRAFASETSAWRQLISMALARGDAEEVWQIYQRWSRAAPGEKGVQIETAIMGHLLQQRGAPGVTITGELVRSLPSHPGAAVAHALALWRSGRLAEALDLLAPLPAAVFAEPRYALAYGLMLADAGRAEESDRMLNRAAADRMLPAELLLIEQARARNGPRLTAPARG